MNARKRKPLGDALAEQFVFGETAPPVERLDAEPTNAPDKVEVKIEPDKETNLMEKLKIEPREATVRLTVDLPESTHRKLSILAANTGRKKAEIVRLLLDDVLKDVT
jgi:hypothetical protein